MIIRLIAALLLFASRSFAADYYSVIAADLPAHWYHVAEASGTTANDDPKASFLAIGGTYSGTYTQAVTGIIGYPGISLAVNLLGTGYVALSNSTDFTIDNTSGRGWTAELWVKPNAVGVGHRLIARDTSTTTEVYQIRLRADNKADALWLNSACSGDYAQVITTSTVSAGVWYHLVATAVAGASNTLTSLTIYMNGIQEATQTGGFAAAQRCISSTQTTDIGRETFGSTNFTNSVMDEVAFYRTASDGTGTGALTGSQIAIHYTAGILSPSRGWPFTVRRPSLPHFRDDNFWDRMVAGGYHDGSFANRGNIERPLMLMTAYAPFGITPDGRGRFR